MINVTTKFYFESTNVSNNGTIVFEFIIQSLHGPFDPHYDDNKIFISYFVIKPKRR